jgi:uncharacterized protein YecA (UPF0149 family)
MDTRNGQIHAADELGNMHPTDRAYMREMGHHPTPIQRAEGKVGRNDPCPCGSGRKFKRCCLFGGKQ